MFFHSPNPIKDKRGRSVTITYVESKQKPKVWVLLCLLAISSLIMTWAFFPTFSSGIWNKLEELLRGKVTYVCPWNLTNKGGHKLLIQKPGSKYELSIKTFFPNLASHFSLLFLLNYIKLDIWMGIQCTLNCFQELSTNRTQMSGCTWRGTS